MRPLLEQLEEHIAPATLVVDNPTDTVVVNETSLRQAVAIANADAVAGTSDSIVFVASLTGLEGPRSGRRTYFQFSSSSPSIRGVPLELLSGDERRKSVLCAGFRPRRRG